MALDAERFLREMDEASFAPGGTLSPDAAARALSLYKTIDAEALARLPIAVPTLCIIGLLAIGVATASAKQASPAQEAFDRGSAAYQKHEFVAAREAFGAAVVAEPRAPDAWADLGTASWAVADTARSVAAWQRALRLEPLATDVRDRVELVHALTWTSAGYVPPIPAAVIFDLAAALWCLAWIRATIRAVNQKRMGGRELASLATTAAIVVVIGFALADRLSGRHIGVIRRTGSLNTEPRLGSDESATAIIGEVVRVRGQQGAWSRVVLDDGRDGWIESAGLIGLDARDASEIEGGAHTN
ncbi:MAG TPA: SH3 domain-containing protein [Polyangiales bacterium]|nr:SH3 domain-containing protein [Polyangiales bacterium]